MTNLPRHPQQEEETTPSADRKKKNIIAGSMAVASAALITVGAVTLATGPGNDENDSTRSGTQETTTTTARGTTETDSTSNMNTDTAIIADSETSPDTNNGNLSAPPVEDGTGMEALSEEDAQRLDEIAANSSNEKIIKMKADQQAKFGSTLDVDGLTVTVSEPKNVTDNSFTVDVTVENTGKSTAGFSGSYLVNTDAAGEENIPLLDSSIAFGTGPLKPGESLSGSLEYDMAPGVITFFNLNTQSVGRWA